MPPCHLRRLKAGVRFSALDRSLMRMELAGGVVATAATRAKVTLLQRLARTSSKNQMDVYVRQWLDNGHQRHVARL